LLRRGIAKQGGTISAILPITSPVVEHGNVLGGFETAIVFIMLVMPGLVLIGGYYTARRTKQRTGLVLHTLGQALAWSLLLLLPAIGLLASDLASWIKHDTVPDHLQELLLAGYLTVFLPFLLGAGAGWMADRFTLVARIHRPRRCLPGDS